ncbi:MAG TPA: protein kinase, partial [Candidatus Krumholzibacteria bacterium]|nr:protein kinase [Candidatus Krumholzibacteria bacterium]
MTLNAGTRLGPYEILSPLGAGGMGEVYRAKDTRLGREVAVKVLPQHLSSNPEVRARFEREARTVSSLNHPNICTLFDVGRDGDVDYLVMELVEGETLAARLMKGSLSLADSLRIGGEIADALDRAHRAGVVHRDLKPGNVMLTRSGAKLMDFGLARASGLAPAPGSGVTVAALTQSPTMAQPLTAEGTIVGTFQYMSPEQLEGKEADARSDVWALGCVLYEMSTGRRAFDGKSQASLITSIMGSQPAPISQVSPMTPPAMDRLVQAMLAKDPADRVQSAHDVKLQLAWISEGGSGAGLPKVVARSRRNRERMAWIAAIVLAVVAGGLAHELTMTHVAPAQVTRTYIPAPPSARLQITGDDSGPPAISPDGTMLVFTAVGGGGGKRLWLRRLDDFTAQPLKGTDEASYPFWKPDNTSIGFYAGDKLRRLDLATGSVVTLVDGMNSARGGTWSKDGVILYAPGFSTPLYRVPESGGTPQTVTTIDTTMVTTNRFPQFLPDGKHFIYLAASHLPGGAPSTIYCGSLDGGPPVKVLESKASAIYADGFLFFVRDSTLMAQPFNTGSLTTRGELRATSEAVHFDHSTWNSPISVSNDGVLVYGVGGSSGNNRAALYDRAGHRIRNLTPSGNILTVNATRDFRRLAFEWQQQPLADIWTADVATGTRSRVTTSPDDDGVPVWLPDGKSIVYSAREKEHYAIYEIRADGTTQRRLVVDVPKKDTWPFDVSSDGRWLLYAVGSYGGSRVYGAMWLRALAGGDARQLIPESDQVFSARISPDGKWIAFDAMVSGHSEVYVSPMPVANEGLSARWQVSTSGGKRPLWRGDSREIYYGSPDGMV